MEYYFGFAVMVAIWLYVRERVNEFRNRRFEAKLDELDDGKPTTINNMVDVSSPFRMFNGRYASIKRPFGVYNHIASDIEVIFYETDGASSPIAHETVKIHCVREQTDSEFLDSDSLEREYVVKTVDEVKNEVKAWYEAECKKREYRAAKKLAGQKRDKEVIRLLQEEGLTRGTSDYQVRFWQLQERMKTSFEKEFEAKRGAEAKERIPKLESLIRMESSFGDPPDWDQIQSWESEISDLKRFQRLSVEMEEIEITD